METKEFSTKEEVCDVYNSKILKANEKIKKGITEVYWWQYENTDSFYNNLIDLYRKGDVENKKKLRTVFNEICFAVDLWEVTGSYGDDLFRQFGLLPKNEFKNDGI